MPKILKPNVSDNTLFICQLPKETQEQIKRDLEQHALVNGYELKIDKVTGEYFAMQDRFLCIEDIYE